jgi:signal transduction histidine kinase
MIDVMGGEIAVESEEGRGSTFTVRLREATPSATPVA